LKTCGHVFCHTCVGAFIQPTKTCLTCDIPFHKEKDIIQLNSSEGTGYSGGGGKVQIEKYSEVFQA
jgi:nitric oxide synthase-interacting protein